jgi:hypothetical protein
MTPDHRPRAMPLRPAAPGQLPAPGADLDTQIEQIEQRLVAREAWVRSTASSLAQQARHAITPKPWVLPVVSVGAVLWMGWLWRHRRAAGRTSRPAVPAPAAARPGEVPAELPWAGLAALGWPLLPVTWRGRLSPAAAAAGVSAVLSILRRLRLRRRVR